MRTNIALTAADTGVLIALLVLMLMAVLIVKGFFNKGKKPSKTVPGMVETDVEIDGMHCGMCEAHINDAIRKLHVSKVSSSWQTGKVIILARHPVTAADLHSVIDPLGYTIRIVDVHE